MRKKNDSDYIIYSDNLPILYVQQFGECVMIFAQYFHKEMHNAICAIA